MVVAVNFLMTPVYAEEEHSEREPASRYASVSDAEVDARLEYLVQRLDYRSDYSTWWWRGWTGFYALGVVIQGTRAGLENDDSSQADLAISAAKATLGTVQLLRHPFAWEHGADSVRDMPGETRADRLQQLATAENMLHRNAKVTDRRLNWISHASNVAINAAGAALVHGVWDDPSRGWRSAGIGIVVGEIMLFSHPWWARNDYDEYERRFTPGASAPKISWQVVPTLNGVALHARF
jgi:hypothetical protein